MRFPSATHQVATEVLTHQVDPRVSPERARGFERAAASALLLPGRAGMPACGPSGGWDMFRDILMNEPPAAVLYALLAEGIALVAMGVWLLVVGGCPRKPRGLNAGARADGRERATSPRTRGRWSRPNR